MNDDRVPAVVKEFIADHINSVEQLEVLLLLHRRREATWGAAEVGRELRIDQSWAAAQLEDLSTRGLLARTQAAAPLYQYGPATPALEQAVGALAATYAERRVTVISLIFAKPNDNIRTFADAFRFRKDE